MSLFAYFTADPDRIFFVIPYLNHPVTWYGLLFAIGFLVGYFLIKRIFLSNLGEGDKAEATAVFLADRLSMFVVLGTLVGARLGHVFLYDWPIYKEHPWDIIKIWEGGLASHGGAMGIFLSIFLFFFMYCRKYPSITLMVILDSLVIGAAFAGGMIRLGNFMNQEILGMATTLPWGVIFMHPMGGPKGVPLHPVQLYESIFYFSLFFVFCLIWKREWTEIGKGLFTGLFFVCVFAFRFFIEFLKLPLSQLIDENAYLDMGQWLSLPFILLGCVILLRFIWQAKTRA